MRGCLGGCLGRLVGLLFLVVLVVALWRFGPDLGRQWLDWRTPSASADTSPELAAGVLTRYERLLSGQSDEILLSGAEVESFLRYTLDGAFPSGVTEPVVVLHDDQVRIVFQVEPGVFLEDRRWKRLGRGLPDALPVGARGRLLPASGGRAIFMVLRMDAAGIPLPGRMIPGLLDSMELERDPLLPPEALSIPLPPGVSNLRVEGDVLIVN